MDLTITIFLLVYVAMALGHLPGFLLDRTAAALVGALLLIVLGRITPAAAWQAIDYRTIGLLFGLMVIASSFAVAGFYGWVARAAGAARVGPQALLAILIAVAAVMSALLTKDVVAAAMTPVLAGICVARRLNPVPFLLGFCFAVNVGSSATLIGSPQNMITAETLGFSFTGFMAMAALPALVGLPIIWLVVTVLYRRRWALAAPKAAPKADNDAPVALDRGETAKAAIVTAAVIVAFVATDWPHMLIALCGASVLLISRRVDSERLLGKVDGNLLVLLFGLFIVNAAFVATDLPQRLITHLSTAGFDLQNPMSLLLVMAVLSNIVGNNPAVMLVTPFLKGATHPDALGAALVLGTNFSSNAVLFGSLAGIIVTEEGSRRGITIDFAEFAKAGVPTSILCLLLAAGWIFHLT
ncbi:SLC13 family permease [Azospirillum ramasamyi]|uniref:Transporter n=1 Tax=Azospirillum ramasamyi TaxID=682998 RepID=A0A2U9S271_9PROT|nr:SLC13 family permease [Azospirillum ramasamyi]AWU92981.1 transporter [Azospirillum ramasamyi]